MSKKQQNIDNAREECHVMDWEKKIDFDKTIHIVFDTSILRKKPYHSNEEIYRDLALLAKEEVTKLYIPEIAKREYVRSNSYDCNQCIRDIKKGYENLKGYFKDTQEEESFFENKKVFDALSKESNDIIEKKFVDFFTQCNVNFCAMQPTHHENVWKKYFKQEFPFQEGKSNEGNRKHIPDAYIFEVLLEIQKISNNIIFLCHDENLRNTCNAFNIVAISDPNDFLNNPAIKEKVEKIKKNEKQYQKILELIGRQDIQQKISSFMENYELIYLRTIRSDYFPDNEAYCSQITSVIKQDIHDKEPILWDENSFDFRVNFLTTAILEIPVYKGEDYTKYGKLIDDLNEHYHEVEGEYILFLKARIAIQHKNNVILDMRVDIDHAYVITKKDIEYKCTKCGNVHYLSYNNLEREWIESYERGMGSETHWRLYSSLICEKCENNMEINIDIWEYPEGCLNDISCSNCQGCQCEINRNNSLPFGLS